MNPIQLRLILFIFLCSATHVWAIDIGLGVSATATTFTVGDGSGSKIADLQSKLQLGPYIKVASEPNYFGESNWGYYFYSGASSHGNINISFAPNGQSSQTNSSPINSSVIYAGAALFYSLGDKITQIDKGIQHTVGMGFGAGRLKAYGTVDAALTSTGSPEHFDFSKNGLSVDLYYRYINNGWFFEAGVDSVETYGNNRYYKSNNDSISVGRYFSLDF